MSQGNLEIERYLNFFLKYERALANLAIWQTVQEIAKATHGTPNADTATNRNVSPQVVAIKRER